MVIQKEKLDLEKNKQLRTTRKSTSKRMGV